ncbi:MAG: translation initiation factor IF-2 N-terminal domain-containing protein, partial [Clostridia bacterium]|nr:translation initiation factor IF-2 N-terminal domain-containing protein [Clostridia bacterium]
MATTSEKYRINALAKDLDVKSKDLITILDEAGFAGRTHMAVLDEEELSIIFETLTQRNQVDITAFFKEYDDKKNAKKEEERKAQEAARAAADEEKR